MTIDRPRPGKLKLELQLERLGARHRSRNARRNFKPQRTGSETGAPMDGRVVHDLKNTLALTRSLFASATLENASGEVIVKIVNAAYALTEAQINLAGAKTISGPRTIVLTSESPTDENSLAGPLKVSPKTETLNVSGPKFKHTFPANSLTVMRVKTAR